MKYTDINKVVSPVVNITDKQRMVSAVTGGLLLAMGIFGFGKSSFRRAVRMTAGSLLILRGLTGYCPMTALQNAPEENPVEENSGMLVSG
ncbi:MAG TPA: YgaP-like transmembrane domain [Puia sp.]|nr:YgaP-like transmembrane domain [Puia sp.]